MCDQIMNTHQHHSYTYFILDKILLHKEFAHKISEICKKLQEFIALDIMRDKSETNKKEKVGLISAIQALTRELNLIAQNNEIKYSVFSKFEK